MLVQNPAAVDYRFDVEFRNLRNEEVWSDVL
jgi:hypothetical protein